MARIRSVHPSLFTDEAWVSCSPLARILYIGLWTDADDQGLFEWKPLQIKMRLLPGDAGDVLAMLSELERVSLVRAYEADGKRYGAIANFRKFQRPQKPNAIHPLPESVAEYVGLVPEPPQSHTPPVADQSRTDTVIPPQMEDGGWKVGDTAVANAPAEKSPDGDCRPKATPAPVQEAFDRWNEVASRRGLPVAKSLTPQRRKHLRARLAEAGLPGWSEALDAVERSPLCLGENDRGWRADLDFVLQPKSFARLREGAYGPPPGTGPPAVVLDPEAAARIARHEAILASLNHAPAS